jgi:chorismate mutase / prephenate dehydratase
MKARTQDNKSIAYLGPNGTFSEQAARKYISSPTVNYLPVPSFSEVFKLVEDGEASFGIVPVENSSEGPILATLDLLLESGLMVMNEVELKVEQCLIVRPRTRLEDVRLILSHSQPLAQCRRFIEKTLPDAEVKEVNSTARAVEMLENMENAAAIGPENAAEKYGMKVLLKGIEDNPNNFTRFFVLSKEDSQATSKDKTSIIFSAKNIPGALYSILGAFATRGINLTKIESRPVRGKTWEYVFYMDFEGHRSEDNVKEALMAIEEKCLFVKVLGSYPKANS